MKRLPPPAAPRRFRVTDPAHELAGLTLTCFNPDRGYYAPIRPDVLDGLDYCRAYEFSADEIEAVR